MKHRISILSTEDMKLRKKMELEQQKRKKIEEIKKFREFNKDLVINMSSFKAII